LITDLPIRLERVGLKFCNWCYKCCKYDSTFLENLPPFTKSVV